MKEITIKLADLVAEFISKDAKEMGLTSEELIRYIVGSYTQYEIRANQPKTLLELPNMASMFREGLPEILKSISKDMLKARAKEGALSCKNCTMKLTESDVDAGKCGSCYAPIFDKKSETEE